MDFVEWNHKTWARDRSIVCFQPEQPAWRLFFVAHRENFFVDFPNKVQAEGFKRSYLSPDMFDDGIAYGSFVAIQSLVP